jgi:c-di-GMP-binding flagellar brake protein YcgR
MQMKERRLYPRFDVILPVTLEIDGNTVEANIFDISMGGMQLGCDREAAEIIVPTPNQTVSPGLNLVVRASFRCPQGQGVTVECRLVVSRRVSNNEFRIGMEYLAFASEADRKAYEAYIQERMAEVA